MYVVVGYRGSTAYSDPFNVHFVFLSLTDLKFKLYASPEEEPTSMMYEIQIYNTYIGVRVVPDLPRPAPVQLHRPRYSEFGQNLKQPYIVNGKALKQLH